MSERPYRRGGGRRSFFGWLAGAGAAALLTFVHGPPAAAQVVVEPLPRGAVDELPCHGTVVDELDTGDTNVFAFVLQQGDVFIVDAVDVSGSIELLRMRLLGPDGTVFGNTCTGRIQQRAPTAGAYRLEVTDCIGNDAGTYSLSLNLVSDTPRNCAAPLACGDDAESRLDVPGQVDSFSFYGARGEPIALDFESNLDRRGGLEVRVFDPSGIAVLHTCGDTFDFNLPETGRYTILVNACLGKNTGTYSASWRSRSCPTHVGAHSGGGAVGLRLSDEGTAVTQLAASNVSCAFGESSGFVLDFNPPLAVVNRRFSTTATPQDSATNAARLIDIDGVIADQEHTQLLGGLSVRFDAARCNFQWTATSEDDSDWDGWSNDIEEELGSRPADRDSVPEDRRIATTSLFGPGVCRDRFDNDRDDVADGGDPGCRGPLPFAPSVFSSFAGRHSGGAAFTVERSADGSRVTRLTTSSISCGALESHAIAIDLDIPITANRFFATNVAIGSADSIGDLDAVIDGVFFDGDGDGTREQALGMVILRFGEQCPFRWWASAHVDSDGDGWGDVAERRYGSDARPFPQGQGVDSTPEDRRLPTSNLGDPGTCADGLDNDGDGFTDAADDNCPPPTPTPTRTPTVTRTPTPTSSPTRTTPPSGTPTATPSRTVSSAPTATSIPSLTSAPSRTATRTIPPTGTPTPSPPSTSTPVPPTSTPLSPSPTRPAATSTSTPVPPTSTTIPTATPTSPPATEPPSATLTPQQLACNGEGPIRAIRSLPARFRPGEPVELRLDLEVDETVPLQTATIKENLPQGWTFVSSDPPTVGQLDARQVRWAFTGGQVTDEGMDVVYTLEAPATSGNRATFCGAVEYRQTNGDRGCLTLGCAVLQRASCPGDCDGNGVVSVDEVLLQVGISLGGVPVNRCPAGDIDGNGAITIDEVLTTVNAALSGCSS